MDNRFILQESQNKEGHWVCTDKLHNIVCVFEDHKFNDTQEFTLLDGNDFETSEEAVKVATYLREMADWLRDNHYDKVF